LTAKRSFFLAYRFCAEQRLEQLGMENPNRFAQITAPVVKKDKSLICSHRFTTAALLFTRPVRYFANRWEKNSGKHSSETVWTGAKRLVVGCFLQQPTTNNQQRKEKQTLLIIGSDRSSKQ